MLLNCTNTMLIIRVCSTLLTVKRHYQLSVVSAICAQFLSYDVRLLESNIVIQAREKQLQQQVRNLQQLVDSLREDLNKEKKCNEDLLKHLNEMVTVHNIQKSSAVVCSLNQQLLFFMFSANIIGMVSLIIKMFENAHSDTHY